MLAYLNHRRFVQSGWLGNPVAGLQLAHKQWIYIINLAPRKLTYRIPKIVSGVCSVTLASAAADFTVPAEKPVRV